jgi:hypothetical protein
MMNLTPDQLQQLTALLMSFGVQPAAPVNLRPGGPFAPIVNGVPPSPDPAQMLPLFQITEPAYPPGLSDQAQPLAGSAKNFIGNVIDTIRVGNIKLLNAISGKNGDNKFWNAVGRTQNPAAPAPAPMASWATFFPPLVLELLKGDPNTVIVYDPTQGYTV